MTTDHNRRCFDFAALRSTGQRLGLERAAARADWKLGFHGEDAEPRSHFKRKRTAAISAAPGAQAPNGSSLLTPCGKA